MSTLALELHEEVATAASLPTPGSASLELRASVPGIVRLDGRRLLVGEAALEGARALPRNLHDRFWHALSTEPLGAPFPRGWSVADLAHAHLEELWRRAGENVRDVILVTDGRLAGERLGLAVGIAQALGIPLRGVLPSALAAAAGAPPRQRWLHLDLGRHAAMASLVERRGHQLKVTAISEDLELGRQTFLERFAATAAEAFLRSTRFDPLHRSADEQQLFDHLPAWLDALARQGTATARLERRSTPVEIELTRAEMLAPVGPELVRLLHLTDAADTAPILLSPHADLLGVAAALREAGREVHELSPEDALAGALRHRDLLIGEGPPVLTVRLPAPGPTPLSPQENPPTPPTAEPPPTHLLVEGVAHRLSRETTVATDATTGTVQLIARAPSGAAPGKESPSSIKRLRLRRHDGGAVIAEALGPGLRLEEAPFSGETQLHVGARILLEPAAAGVGRQPPELEIQLIRLADAEEGEGDRSGGS